MFVWDAWLVCVYVKIYIINSFRIFSENCAIRCGTRHGKMGAERTTYTTISGTERRLKKKKEVMQTNQTITLLEISVL